MKKSIAAIFILMTIGFGQFVPNISVATVDDANATLINSAGLGLNRDFNMWITDQTDWTKLDSITYDFGFYGQAGISGFGFTYMQEGRDILHSGSGQHLGGGFYLGSTSHISSDGYEAIDMGLLYRGFSWFSAGLQWKNLWSRDRGGRQDQQYQVGVAFRPFGNRLTVAYDHRFSSGPYGESSYTYQDGGGIAQLQAEVIDGIKLFAGYDLAEATKGMQVGISVGFGQMSVETFHNFDSNSDYVGPSLTGYFFSEEKLRTVIKSKKPTFVELGFERPMSDSPSPSSFFGSKTVTLREMVDEINALAENPNVDGIILRADHYGSGTGMFQEIVDALRKVKASGKKILAFMDYGSDQQYALACLADSIYLNSGGTLQIMGAGAALMFYKGLFDKLGIDAQFYRRGDYKTAAEPYTREELTETSREAYEEIVHDLQTFYSGMIKRGRGWSDEKLNEVYNQSGFTAPMALKAGLIDGIYHPDEIEKKVKEIAGDKVVLVRIHKQSKPWEYDWKSPAGSKIAVIYAEGPIQPGKSQPSPFGGDKIIGSETTSKAIRKAREDKSVKAIVLRVNSPGGSVLASEDIWREVHRTTHPDSADEENQKPFIVSMGNVAGSGGYYISCAADTIVADSTCITGSIGVLGGKISLGGLFEKIGLNMDVVKEQEHADAWSIHRSFTEEEGKSYQGIIDSFYEQFLSRVAEGRGMTTDEVDAIAQGRIWTGMDAKEIGLVDELGGLERAIEIAEEMAGLDENKYELQINPGIEGVNFEFKIQSKSDMQKLLAAFEEDIPVARLLDRAKLIHDEKVLYLMDLEFIEK